MNRIAGDVIRRGLVGVDQGAAKVGIFLGDKLDRYWAEIRIAVVSVSVGISQFHRLDNGMDIICRVMPHRLEIEAFQQVEILEEDRRLAPEPHLVNLDATVSCLEGLFHPRVVGSEVPFTEQATGRLTEIADSLRNGPSIKVVADRFESGSASLGGVLLLDLRQALKGSGQIGLNEEFASLRQMPARHINSNCVGPLLPYRP